MLQERELSVTIFAVPLMRRIAAQLSRTLEGGMRCRTETIDLYLEKKKTPSSATAWADGCPVKTSVNDGQQQKIVFGAKLYRHCAWKYNFSIRAVRLVENGGATFSTQQISCKRTIHRLPR